MSENAYSTYNDSPGLVKTIAVLTLINGIVNIFWGLIATATVTSNFFLWCLTPFAVLPTVLGIFEIIYAAKLLTDPPQPVQPSQTIAILEILCVLTGNVFSMIVGILSLVFYNDQQVKDYFARLNVVPEPVPPQAPVPPSPTSAPVMEAETPGEAAPETPAAPKPKKPRPRKVAAEKTETDSKPEKPKRTHKSGNSSS